MDKTFRKPMEQDHRSLSENELQKFAVMPLCALLPQLGDPVWIVKHRKDLLEKYQNLQKESDGQRAEAGERFQQEISMLGQVAKWLSSME